VSWTTSTSPSTAGDAVAPPVTVRQTLERHAPALVALPGVVGVGEGQADGRPCITVYVAEETAGVEGQIPAELEGWRVVIRKSGHIRALTDGQ
jgi:hypothetical protein